MNLILAINLLNILLSSISFHVLKLKVSREVKNHIWTHQLFSGGLQVSLGSSYSLILQLRILNLIKNH